MNDTIVQGLVAAEMALDLGQVDYARQLIAQHLAAGPRLDRRARRRPGARSPGMAVRSDPARRPLEETVTEQPRAS